MKVRFFTLVLDGMPFICNHLPVFNRLNLDWSWRIAEGAAMNNESTSWCKPQQPRLSRDGTTQYLDGLFTHPKIRVHRQKSWLSKDAMVRACVEDIKEETILIQIDADEHWESWQLEKIAKLFEVLPKVNAMKFFCRYFVGQNIITVGENCYGNNPGEWSRAWRFKAWSKVISHEPAVFSHCEVPILTRDETAAYKLTFDHYAYVNEQQVSFKANFYGYPSAVSHWKRLQLNSNWPVRLIDFLPWVDDRVMADQLHR